MARDKTSRNFVARLAASQSKKLTPLAKKLVRSACSKSKDHVACVASVSVRSSSKERGTRVKDRAKNGARKRAGRGWGRKEGSRFVFRADRTGFFFLLRNQTETLATQAKDHAAIFFSVRTTAYCLGATRMT